jgi:hypothetical protein
MKHNPVGLTCLSPHTASWLARYLNTVCMKGTELQNALTADKLNHYVIHFNVLFLNLSNSAFKYVFIITCEVAINDYQLRHVSQFVYLAVCPTRVPKPLPKPALHIVRSRASSFKWQYPLLSLRSSSSFPRLLPHLPVTSITSFNFLQ